MGHGRLSHDESRGNKDGFKSRDGSREELGMVLKHSKPFHSFHSVVFGLLLSVGSKMQTSFVSSRQAASHLAQSQSFRLSCF